MKRIILNTIIVLLTIYSNVSFGQILEESLEIDLSVIKKDEYLTKKLPLDDIYNKDPDICYVNCGTVETIPNYIFTTSSSFDIALANHNATVRAAELAHRTWYNKQKSIMKDYLDSYFNTEFSSYTEARNTIFNSIESQNINLNVPPLKRKHSANNYRSKRNYTRSLKELNLLTLRENEISSGNINNSQYGNIKVSGVFLKDLTTTAALKAKKSEVTNSFKDQYLVNFDGKLIYDKLNDLGADLSNYTLSKKISYYNNYNDWDKLSIVQYHINYNQIKKILSCIPCIHPAELDRFKDVVDVAQEEFIEDYAKLTKAKEVSVFNDNYWQVLFKQSTGIEFDSPVYWATYHPNLVYYHMQTAQALSLHKAIKKTELDKLLATNNFSAEYLKIENFIGELGVVSSAQKEWLHSATYNTEVNNLIDFANDNRVNGEIPVNIKGAILESVTLFNDLNNFNKKIKNSNFNFENDSWISDLRNLARKLNNLRTHLPQIIWKALNINLNTQLRASLTLTAKTFNPDVESLSEAQKNETFRFGDGKKGVGILLYEFANGQGPEIREFSNGAFWNDFFAGDRIDKIKADFERELLEEGITFNQFESNNNVLTSGYSFSPDHAGVINSINEHINANIVQFFVGGSAIEYRPTNQPGYIDVKLSNPTSRYSLLLHIGDNYSRSVYGSIPLSTIMQHFYIRIRVR